jgi:hypothetical protein
VSQNELGRTVYALAKDFLLQASADQGVTPDLIEKYLHLSTPRRDSLAGLYGRTLTSVQNVTMKGSRAPRAPSG